MPLTRRQFAQALTGGLATMALGSLFGCAPQQAAAAEAHETVDFDVVVLGGGGAGVTAAGQAAAAGAKTVLLEKMAWLAGSSSLAIGTFYGAGTQLQKAAGIEDDPSGLLDYFLSRGGDKLDYDVQKFCAEHFGETIDWLTGELGVPFKETVSKKGKDPVPRGHNCANNAMDALRAVTAYAQEHGAEFHFGTTVESLVVDDGGAVTGVLAKRGNGSTVLYNAKNVIVSTGGFCRNVEMIDEYCPDYSGVYTEVGVGCTGEGLQMGLDIGADYVPTRPARRTTSTTTWRTSTIRSSSRCTTRPWWTRLTRICAANSTSAWSRACSRRPTRWPRRLQRLASTALRRKRRSTRTTSWLRPARTPSSRRRPRISFRSRRLPSTC